MNKFLLRNLKNERRRIEKQLEKIDKEIHKVTNSMVILEGTMDLDSLVKVKDSFIFTKSDINFNMKFKIIFERFENEVTCTLIADDDKFKKNKRFVGKSICYKDEKFDLAVGMALSQNRAIEEVYKYIIGLFN